MCLSHSCATGPLPLPCPSRTIAPNASAFLFGECIRVSDAPRFLYERQAPGPALRSVVSEYWLIQAETCRTEIEIALPDPAALVYFNLGPRGRQLWSGGATTLARRTAWVMGPHADALLIAKELTDCDIIGVRLHAGAVHSMLGIEATELTGAMIDLCELWGSTADHFVEQLHEARTPEQRFAVLD